MYYDEGLSKLPHFYVKYGEYWAVFLIDSLEIIEGEIPKTAIKLVKEWAGKHRNELIQNYKNMQEGKTWTKIEPLEEEGEGNEQSNYFYQ
jgi:hypothetical protein